MSRYIRMYTASVSVALLITAATSGVPFTRADDGQHNGITIDEIEGITAATLPIGAGGQSTVTVMVKLTGDPVALVKAAKPNKQISDAERASVKADLKAKQDALLASIAAAGGTVLGQYQSAYNGIKVKIDRAAVGALQALPSVEAVVPVERMERDNSVSVPYIGAPQTWAGTDGLRGENIKVGIIDTGIDYTHANFGGPGTVAAYNAAHAAEAAPADPALFGASAPKVKGGVDLVGDDYNAAADPDEHPEQLVPHPDANPLDCNGHGSHVAGTAAGYGVAADGTTYHGVYDTTINFGAMVIGPGVAPLADLYAIRVFGCEGSTDVTVDAIDWAVDHDLDVINMSLGSSFGRSDDPSAVASDNAMRSGMVVVTSAGNSGSAPYITGSPSTATRAISVAANDAAQTFPGATLTLSGGTGGAPSTLAAINANNGPLPTGALGVVILRNVANGSVSLGCAPGATASDLFPAGTGPVNTWPDYAAVGNLSGKIVVVARGTCGRVAKAVYAQQAGASAVLMINNASGYPPFEGTITSNPDNGQAYTVTIPFLGVRSTDATAITSRGGGSATFAPSLIANPAFSAIASFSSGGPRLRDSMLKPDITAPGVSTRSTGVGTGNQPAVLSGTSMAAPHVTGVAALVLQTQKGGPQDETAERVKAALMNTATPAAVAGFATRNAGAGLVNTFNATHTHVVADGDAGTASLSFGYNEFTGTYTATKSINVHRLKGIGDGNESFTVAVAGQAGSPHTISLSKTSLKTTGNADQTIDVTISIPAGTTGTASALRDARGFIELRPVGGSNGGITLRVPYYTVIRGLTNVSAAFTTPFGPSATTGNVQLTNPAGSFAGGADFYAWGITSPNAGHGQTDLRAAGVQSFASGSNRLLWFAVNTWERFSNAAVNEYDIYIDNNNDGHDDFIVFGADNGLIQTGTRDGVFLAGVYSFATNAVTVLTSQSTLTDNSTVLIPVFSNRIGLSAANPRFTYHVSVFAGRDGTDDIGTTTATVNAFSTSISTGAFQSVASGATVNQAVTLNATEWAQTPALGVMVVATDNAAGAAEARLLSVPNP